MAEDNWQHRSIGMTCATCMAFVAKASPAKKLIGSDDVPSRALGRCRRHAPVAGGIGWPAVWATDWCLDHKLDETKT